MAIGVLFNLGCATGGGDVDTGAGEERFEVEDERGFSRELGPAEIAYQSAMQFLASGNYQDAIENLKRATMLKPTYLEAWSELGKAYTTTKNHEAGIQAFEKALELSPDNDALIGAIGYNYLYLERWDEAEGYYNKLIEKDSLSYEGNVHLGFIYQKRGDNNTAIRFYELVLKRRPDDATTMGTLASLYGKKGDEASRLEYLRRAIEAAPDNYKFKTQLGSAYLKSKDYEKAVPVFEDLVAQFPDVAAYQQNLGLVLSQTDRKAEAPAALEKAIEIKGDDPYIFAVLSQIYNELNQPNKAIETVQRGLQLGEGQGAFLHYQWGVALSKLEQYDQAIGQFNKTISYQDPQWTGYARKQIDRQEKLKKRAQALKERDQYE
jgi:tetratricopeptide (TPR) repeat protein